MRAARRAEEAGSPATPSEHLLELFARQAAILLANTQTLSDARRLSAELTQALNNRDLIGQAKGVLIAQGAADEQVVVSLPLIMTDRVVGAMNVYAHAEYAFDDRAAKIGEVYAAPAAVAVQNAQILAQTQRFAARLQKALETRAVIERAVGIILSRSGGTEAEALNRLRSLSQQEHHKLSEVAQRIVDEAVRRAEARRPNG